MKRLLVVAPNWLGDAVMALPALADVRRALPDVSIAIAARSPVAPLFALVEHVDEVIAVPGKGSYPCSGFDAAVLLPNSFHSALSLARGGVPERWGYRTDFRRWLLTRAVDPPPDPTHQVDAYQHLIGALGFPNGPGVPRIDVPPAARESGAAALRSAGWDGRVPLVALAPGAAGGRAKRWPPSSFADLASGLADDGIATVTVGAASDGDTAAELNRAIGRRTRPFDLVGKTDIATLAGVLVNCRGVVANDSGAMHLAAAVGVRVTALFGPTDERRTAPRGDVRTIEPPSGIAARPDAAAARAGDDARACHAVLANRVWCRPCMLRECPLDHACLRGISVAAALDAVRRSC